MSNSRRALALSPAQREQLEQWLAAHGTPQQVALRCRIVLAATQGGPDLSIAAAVGVNRHTVTLWRKRFAEQGLQCLWQIAPGRGRKPVYGTERIKAVVDATLQTKPKGQTHWSCRLMAQRQGMSKSTISNIWRSHNTQPGLPLKKGRCGTMTHDYKRNGTTTLFAAIELLEGKVIGQCYQRHRHQEFLRFLRRLDQEFPANLGLHLVIDNYGTHSHPQVAVWLKQHPRFVLHFVPTSCSWLNLIERWFRELTTKRIRRDSFPSVPDLKAAIEEFLEAWNEKPKPFVWRATLESILAKLSGCRQTLEQIEPGCTLPRKRKLRQLSV